MTPPNTVTLWLVRHPRPLVADGVCYGRSDLPADAAHAQAAAQALSRALIEHPATSHEAGWHVVSSPLLRARALAEALRERLPGPVQWDERLAEMDFGAWEGRRWDALPRDELDAWTADFPHHRVGGSGESVTRFMDRVAQAWKATQAEARRKPDRPVVWITHAGVIRAMQLLQAGVRVPATATDWPREAPGFGEWTTIQADTRP